MEPWDQRVARRLVRPLARTSITPNQVTLFTLVLALAGAWMLSLGSAEMANWGAGVFVIARFMDHFDGELARLTGRTSRLGYYLDYMAGAASYTALFLGIGIGLQNTELGSWSLVLGLVGGISALACMGLNLRIDEVSETDEAIGYPAFAGFELEDGIYLIAPITWLGFLPAFFVFAGVGASVYLLWTLLCVWRLPGGDAGVSGTKAAAKLHEDDQCDQRGTDDSSDQHQ